MKKNSKQFNIIISGTGGQGLITLLQIISEAALIEKYDVKTSELHGLSQRGGSVEVHIRLDNKIYSPLIKKGGADLIISLEAQESLSVLSYSSKEKTTFLINNFFIPIPGEKLPTAKNISQFLKKFAKKIILVPASDICQKTLGADVVAGIYLLGFSVSKKLIPLKSKAFISAINKIIPEKYLELNLKAFKLASKH